MIPDFIPILGYIDDIILIPLGIAIALKMLPSTVVQEHEAKAEERLKMVPKNWFVGSLIILIWIFIIWVCLLAYGSILI